VIFAFSTSSRLASVAVVGLGGDVLWEGELDAPQSASSACMSLLARAATEGPFKVEDGTLFVADLGPGSFTGVRVGIVLAKTFAFLFDKPCAGSDAFDLVSPNQTVVLPLKRGEYFIRRPGCSPVSTTILPDEILKGYGPPELEPDYPRARGFGALVGRLTQVSADELVPKYLIEPSISLPKKPMPGVRS
jgi:tRNA threonylcarbamoyl adenosine modification protein YeaZ